MKHGSCISQPNEDYYLENKSIATAIDLEQAEDMEERRCYVRSERSILPDDEEEVALKPSKPGVIITIAREHGSSGKQIGKMVARKLGIPFYYKEMIALAAHESGLDRDFISELPVANNWLLEASSISH